MKAIQIEKYGGVEVSKLNLDAPVPSVSNGKVLVKVVASSANPIDWKVREGIFKPSTEAFPITLGGDFSGIVEEVGEGVEGYKKGDKVYGHGSILAGGSGSYAEFVLVPVGGIAMVPEGLDNFEAAGLPLVGVSAVIALVEHMSIKAGQRLLVHGAAGGIGSLAVQIAKSIGAFVVGTASESDIDFVKELGADEVIDYKKTDFVSVVNNMDAVFDTVGGETYVKSFLVTKPGGIIVSMLEQPNAELMEKYNVRAVAQFSQVTSERLNKLNEFVEIAKVRVVIDREFKLEDGGEALEYLKTGHHKGKVIIKVQ